MKSFERTLSAIVFSPVLWGGIVTCAFYAPLHLGFLRSPFLMRYFGSHAIEHVATLLFFVGVASLVLKYINLGKQEGLNRQGLLDEPPVGGQPISHAQALLHHLAELPTLWQDFYLVRRLREALQHVLRRGDAEKLEDELHYLSELDVSRMHATYSLVRIIIWAIPILGLLGTVIGITQAVANLSPKSLESSITEVTTGLGVAFDHTALALSLSMGLMFVQYFVERRENRLISQVEHRTNAELIGRFVSQATSHDPDVSHTRRMAEAVLAAVANVVDRQAELWRDTMDAAHQRWSQLTASSGQQIESALAIALGRSLQEHATALIAGEQAISEQNRRHWQQVQAALLQSTEAATAQQQELVRQGEVLTQVVTATGQVARLESELNRNLTALTISGKLEETVMTLSAAAQLLTARLGQISGERVDLRAPRGKAA